MRFKVLLFCSPGSSLSCSSASSKVVKMFLVNSGLLPTTVKPFHTYIISCGGVGGEVVVKLELILNVESLKV